MRPLNLGIDVDGVLADFNDSFIDLVIAVSRRNLFPERPFPIPTWNYPEHFGYTRAEVSKVWEVIKQSRSFWRDLAPYLNIASTMAYLYGLEAKYDAHLYFITARPGIAAKKQTEQWLQHWLPGQRRNDWAPTVCVSSQKGLMAQGLELDVYIDDRWENCVDVKNRRGGRVLLMDRPWNADAPHEEYGILRTDTVLGIANDARPVELVAA